MDWHIITSGKGGVGKTLISSMLAAHHCLQGHVLIIDFNGMNADLCRLLAAEEYHEYDYLFSELGEEIGDFHFERVRGLTYGLDYVIGWPNDAFTTINAPTFVDFLVKINEQVKEEIKNKFGLTISTVIIDTSYHFCNIFPGREEIYDKEPFRSLLQKENFFIWFIWVYRQILNLIEAPDDSTNPHHVAARTVKEHARTIEAKMKNDKFGNPFVHVISPLSIGQAVVENNWLGGKTLFEWIKGEKIGVIGPLKALRNFIDNKNIIGSTNFSDFFNALRVARISVLQHSKEKKIEDVNLFFLKVLDSYVSKLLGCPRNVVPIHIYQKELLGYTEANYHGFLDQIYHLEVYKESFSKAYQALTTR